MSGPERVRVLVVGGGPAGLTAAAALAPNLDGTVLVVEREQRTGGIPRHSAHLGYGLRDLHRFLTGPAYAHRLTDLALDAGARLETAAMVTGWAGDRALEITSPRGQRTVQADAVVLATGARERPRAARLIPGDRPDGVHTTGELQNLVHLGQAPVGRRAVVVGAELVSWSAALTLRAAGCRTVLLTTTGHRPQSPAAVTAAGRLGLRVPVARRTRVVRITGRDRVEAVELEHLDTGARTVVSCDTVVTTADWVPDHELARTGGLALDPGTLGPWVDAGLRTSRAGVFAAGNLLHPVDTADVAALDGRHVAAAVLGWLAGEPPAPAGLDRAVDLVVDPPLRWVAPQRVPVGGPAPARRRLLLWSDDYRPLPVVTATQQGRLVGRLRLPWPAAPGRVFRVPSSILATADPEAGEVRLGLAGS